jgi:hypothetical protein
MLQRISDEAYWRGQARRYRLLAGSIRGGRAREALEQLADDFEDKADRAGRSGAGEPGAVSLGGGEA